MADQPLTQPVEQSITKVNDEVAVGEDLEFQRKWWRFENAIWIFFVIVLLCDLAGLFGRGPLAKAHLRSPDGSIDLTYERVERTETPALMTVHFAPGSLQGRDVRLFVSESLVGKLGTRRVIPAPEHTEIGKGGLTYTFPVTTQPASVQFELEPSGPGHFPFTIGIPGASPIQAGVVVMP